MHSVCFFLGYGKTDIFAFRRKLSGIPYNVHQNLFDTGGITLNVRFCQFFFDNKFHTAVFNIICLHGRNFINQYRQREWFVYNINFAGLKFGHIQNIVYQGQKVICRAVRFSQPFFNLRLPGVIVDICQEQVIHTD